jgi:hypothetical protein
MEGFSANHERPKNIESFEDWRTLKMEAPKKAFLILTERGLKSDLESATKKEAEELRAKLPAIIEEYSYNEDGSVQNENRYIVEALARILNAAHKRREYEEALLAVA